MKYRKRIYYTQEPLVTADRDQSTPQSRSGILFSMLPLAALLASLQTLVAAFAKSYREAQTYLSLLMFVPIVPTLLLSLMPFKSQFWMYAVPLMNQQIIITRLMRGDPVPGAAVAMTFACTALAAMRAVLVTARIYQSERLAISA